MKKTMRAGLCLAMLGLGSGIVQAESVEVKKAVQDDLPQLMEMYKHLHANPELSGYELKTAAFLANKAKELGFDVTENVGGTGVVAVLENGEGPVVLIRADMDGLPVVEQTGLPFASTVTATTDEGVESGVMHACAHDTHMSGWYGTAKQLVKFKAQWSGTVVMILQPAEERGKGARDMLADGLYERFPKPDYAFAFHNSASIPAGVIGYTPGYTFANVDSVDIIVKGIGGHGAYPQATKDPVVLGSRIVSSLQTLVSRELDPLDSAVVTVGSFIGGSKHNIISDKATLLLTVRSYSDASRQQLLDGIARIARGEGIAAGLSDEMLPEVIIKDEYTPAAFNNPEFAEEMATYFKSKLGEEMVAKQPPTMAGEDFARYYRADKSIKSLLFWVGGVPKESWEAAQRGEKPLPSLHSPFWAPDAEKVITTATEALTLATMKVLSKPSKEKK